MTAPLDGIRVVDLGQIVSGPMAACVLADQGADVIKVETPGGDPMRGFGPAKGDLSALFITVNRGKRGVALDLRTPGGAAVLTQLVEWADVLIENFRPGALDRLGFAYERCRDLNPRLIYTSVTGFGPDGPYANIRVYDPVIQAVSGLAAMQGGVGNAPELVKSLVTDKVTALTAAQAITAALFHRGRTGAGQRLDVAMLDSAIAFNWVEGMYNHSFLDDPPPPAMEYGAMGQLWEASDGHTAMSALQDHEFRALAGALDMPELVGDPRFATLRLRLANRADWVPAVRARLAATDLDTLMAGFIAHGAVGGRANAVAEVAADPQVRHNATVAEIDHGRIGRVRSPRPAPRFGGSPTVAPRPAPHFGEHSRAVLAGLGHDPAAIDSLIACGAVLAAG